MMNVIALAFLLSYFGAVVVLVPEPHLTRADRHGYEGFAPPPGITDQVKETVHHGYDKTVEGLDTAKDSAKETVKDVYQQAKQGVQDKAELGKQGVQDKAGQVKRGAYETAQQAKQGVQDKAGQVKHGVQETAEKVALHIPSTEDVKHGAHETGEKVASYIPSKEEAASYIPGVETGKEAANALKQKVGETKDSVASYIEDSGPVSYSRESLDNLRRKLEEAKQEASSYMQRRESDAAYLSFADMKKKLDEASAYIPSKESAASYIRGKDSIEGVKKGVQEMTQGLQDKTRDASESAHGAAQETARGFHDKADDVGDRVRNTASSYTQHGEGAPIGGYKGKLGGVFQGMKERLTGGERRGDGSGPLERKVHELCSWFDDGSEVQSTKGVSGLMTTMDAAASRESYAYLMESAMGAIESAREVFEKAVEVSPGGEWREKYEYLADSAKGALESAKEVFERVISAAEGSRGAHVTSQKVSAFGKASNMTRLKEAAVHTKQRLSATLRPLLRAIYLATFSAIYGVTIWMTFLSGHLLARTLPRQQLGIVQSKLFPVYLRMFTGCMALCAIIHAVLHPWPSADTWEHWQYLNFALCIGLSLLNMLVVEPRATKMMFEKLKFEKEEGRGQSGEEVNEEVVKAHTASIDVEFRGLHQIASYLNLASVAGLTWHLWYLANRLVV